MIMKKLLIVVLLVVSASSCVLQKATSSFKDVTPESVFEYPVIADLQIGDKISYHYVPEDIIRKRLTKVELIESAIAATLKENGNADVLLYPQYVFKYVEGSNIKTITVTGYPAKYVFRKVNDNDFEILNSYHSIVKSPHQKSMKKHKLETFGYGMPYNPIR